MPRFMAAPLDCGSFSRGDADQTLEEVGNEAGGACVNVGGEWSGGG